MDIYAEGSDSRNIVAPKVWIKNTRTEQWKYLGQTSQQQSIPPSCSFAQTWFLFDINKALMTPVLFLLFAVVSCLWGIFLFSAGYIDFVRYNIFSHISRSCIFPHRKSYTVQTKLHVHTGDSGFKVQGSCSVFGLISWLPTGDYLCHSSSGWLVRNFKDPHFLLQKKTEEKESSEHAW